MTDDYLIDPDYGTDPGYPDPYGEPDLLPPGYPDHYEEPDPFGGSDPYDYEDSDDDAGYEDYTGYGDYPDAYPDTTDDEYIADYDRDDEPEPLTFKQIRQLVREESDRIQREAYSEEDAIDRAVQRTAQAMEAFYAQREAPLARRELVEDLTVGLGSHAQQYLNDYFQGYTPDVFTAIRQDQKTMDMLRRAAEYEDSRRSVSRPAPRTESTYGVGGHYDENFERSIDAMWKGGFNAVPGLTKDRFRDEMKRRVS